MCHREHIHRGSRRVVLVLLLTILTLSVIPIVPVLGISAPDLYNDSMDSTTDEGDEGDTIWVTSPSVGDVTPGATINVYWDSIRTWDGEKGLLNSTEGEASGEYEVWFDVPGAVAGTHYVWVRDMDTLDTASRPFIVLTKVKVKPSRGLEGDTFTINGYGFDDECDIALLMSYGTSLPDGTNVVGEVGISTADIDGVQTEFAFTLDNNPLEIGSVSVTDSVETFSDNGDGTLTGSLGGDGTVNYVTGEVEVEFNTAPAGYMPITADYEYYVDETDSIYVFTTTVDSDKLGSFEKSVQVPDDTEMALGTYYVHGYDARGNTGYDDFTIGPWIALDVDEEPVGTVVEISGRGFTEGVDIVTGTVTLDGIVCFVTKDDTVEYGRFKVKAVIPSVPDEDDYEITVDDGWNMAGADFEVTGLTDIEVDPNFGYPGSTINIIGSSFTQILGEEVRLSLWDEAGDVYITHIDIFETDEKGEFEGTFTVPARSYANYMLRAQQVDYNIHGETPFEIKSVEYGVTVIPSSGPTGTFVILLGTGFTECETWSATLDGIIIVEEGDVDAEGNLELYGEIPVFLVPTIDPGIYTVTVLDIATDREVETEFTVTAKSMVMTDPVAAPNDYNVTVSGSYFSAEEDTDLEFVLFNVTADGDVDYDWDMDVLTGSGGFARATETDPDGNFKGWWIVPENKVLSLGEYWINVTDDNGLFAQTTFRVCAREPTPCSVWTTDSDGVPKVKFDVGETVYVHWNAGDLIDMTIYAPDEVTVEVEWTRLPKSGVRSFVPSHGTSLYEIRCTGMEEYKIIAVGTFFIIPELPLFGSLLGLVAMFSAFAIIGRRRIH